MKKIDWYIVRKFLGTFVFILLLLVMISVVIDFSEKVDNFITAPVSVSEILTTYYLNFIPHIAALLAPFFILISVIFFSSQLASRSEFIAMTAGGISFYRLLIPYGIGASVLAFLLYFSNHYWIPNANKKRLEFEYLYVQGNWERFKKDIHRQVDEHTFIYLESYKLSDSTGYKFSLEYYEEDQLKYKLLSSKIFWNEKIQQWTIENYFARRFEDGYETIERGSKMDTALAINPSDFEQRISRKEEMTTPELIHYIDELKRAGQVNVEFFELERYRRTSSVYAVFLLAIMGFSIASRKVRGGMGLHLVAGIVVAALFEMIMKFSTTYTTNAELPPVWGVWIPNIIFTFVTLFLIRQAQK